MSERHGLTGAEGAAEAQGTGKTVRGTVYLGGGRVGRYSSCASVEMGWNILGLTRPVLTLVCILRSLIACTRATISAANMSK